MVVRQQKSFLETSKKKADRELMKVLKKQPEYKLYLKKLNYQPRKNIVSPTDLTALITFYRFVLDQKPDYLDPHSRAAAMLADLILRLYEESIPIYALDISILKAFYNTNIEPEIIKQLRLAVPFGIVLFPTYSYDYTDKSLTWVYFQHVDLESDFWQQDQVFNTISQYDSLKENRNFKILQWMTINFSFEILGGGIQINEIPGQEYPTGYFDYIDTDGKNRPEQAYESNSQSIQYLNEILINLDLIFNYQPERITIESTFASKGFGGKKDKNYYSVPLRKIGENYKIKKAYKSSSKENLGTHKSPIAHWRKGHWRNQPYKSRDKPEYRMRWIEPMLIKGENVID